MGLFAKKVSATEWKAGVSKAIDPIAEICDLLETTGNAVAMDTVNGWATVGKLFAQLKTFETMFKSAKRTYKNAGTLRSSDNITVWTKQSLDAFFLLGGQAFGWGKYHYGDVTGGPGDRALTETGLAQRAALSRITNNGRHFAENALKAAEAGRAALAALSLERP